MSMMLMVEAMKAKVGNPSRKLVLLKLADCASDNGDCFPSYQFIADQCEITRRAVMKHVAGLVEMGFLWVEKRKNGEQNHSNIYHLTISKGSEQNALGGSEQDSLGSEQDSLGGSEQDSPITSNSFYPVNEPVNETDTRAGHPGKAKPKKNTQADLAVLQNLGVDEQTAKDWLQTRKEKRAGSLTQTVLAALQREAEKAGLTVAQAVQVAAERNWARFMAWYLQNEAQGFSGSLKNRINRIPKHGADAKSGLAKDIF